MTKFEIWYETVISELKLMGCEKKPIKSIAEEMYVNEPDPYWAAIEFYDAFTENVSEPIDPEERHYRGYVEWLER